MQEPDEGIIEELHNLLSQLISEADKLRKHVDTVQKQGEHKVHQAESVISTNMKQKVKDQAKDTLIQIIEQLVEMNCNFELADIDSSNLSIPYMPVGECTARLKFLAGDSPWNFWLLDETVDTKTVSKILLKKYQNGLLEAYPNPKSSESVCFLDRNKVFRGIVLQTINENRVKVWDCDSNISKAILSDKVFKADPDACSVHASAINCSITKESIDTDLWTTDLRDVFCNVLKETELNVKIIERLAGSLPCFLVSVEMKNDEDNCDGSLEEWILNRLLPELRKLTKIENESVCDFLSSETLNPYYRFNQEVMESGEGDSVKNQTHFNKSLRVEDNNLNSNTNKLTAKFVHNINEEDSVISSVAEDGLVSSSNCEPQLPPKLNHNVPVLDNKQNNTEFKNIRSGQTVAGILNQTNPAMDFITQQTQVTGSYHLGCPVQYTAPYSSVQIPPCPPPAPQLGVHFRPAVTSSQPHPQWKKKSPHRSQADHEYSRHSLPEVVNVMAPEFVPKVNNNTPQNLYNQQVKFKNRSAPPELSNHQEVVHVLLRKPSTLLKPGENLIIMVSHIVSPAEFYVHFITQNNKYLDKLNDDMFTHYNEIQKANYKTWQEAKRTLGEFCACKWLEDNHWYRVQVDNWCPIENHVKVVFVDYGNIEIVPLDCIQPLAQNFTKLSMCAQLCHLAKVLPSVKHKPWSDEAIKFLKANVEVDNSSVYSVTVVAPGDKVTKTNSLSVLLYEGKASEGSKSINEKMVECGLAWSKYFSKRIPTSDSEICLPLENDNSLQVSDDGICNSSDKLDSTPQPDQLVTEEESTWNNWDPLTEEYNSVRNNPARDTDDPGVALIGYSAKDEQRICQFYARDGFCRKTLCTKEHSMPNRDGLTTDKEEVYCRAFTEMTLPSAGESIDVLVTSVSSISLFYVQLPQNRGLDNSLDDDEEETLSLLTEFMNKPENIQLMKYLRAPAAVGQLVLAKWDGQWYRARVVSIEENNLEVMFVDYGSLGFVSELELRDMEPRYLHLPFQAIECSLANIIPPDNSSPDYEKATDILRNLIEGNQLAAKVYDSGDTGGVQRLQVTLQLDTGIDVSEYLISNNLCSLRQ